MKRILLFLICVCIGCAIVIGIRHRLALPSMMLLSDTPFILSPPTASRTGNVVFGNSVVKKQGVHDSGFGTIQTGMPVTAGDAIYVEDGEATVTLDDVSIKMLQGSELFFENLMQSHFFARQRSGDIEVTTKGEMSFRVLRSLVTLTKGTMKTTIVGQKASITVKGGVVMIGTIDDANVTATYTLHTGETASINGTLHTVTIR